MDACFLRRSNVGGLAVQQKVGQGRPYEGSTDVCHLPEFLCPKSNTVNQHQFTDQQVVLNQNVKFGTASLVNAFGDVNEPCVQFTARIACFDVVADVIRGQLRHLGVNLIPAEIVILDVS